MEYTVEVPTVFSFRVSGLQYLKVLIGKNSWRVEVTLEQTGFIVTFYYRNNVN